METNYDFGGWATKSNMRCSDGRTIMKDAFIDNDGQKVPLVWNHQHNESENVLGHALLENREEGVYAYCSFNDTPSGQNARELVKHGDITALSIYANKLKEKAKNVFHGVIREVSLVYAGANPGAYIDSIICHSDGNTSVSEDEGIIYTDEIIELHHAEEIKEDKSMEETKQESKKTVKDVIDGMTEEQQTVLFGLLAEAIGEDDDDDKKEDTEVKHNVFDKTEENKGGVLMHADQEQIIRMAKSSGVGSLQAAISRFAEDNDALAHGFEQIETLFPEYEDVKKGAPVKLERDQGWVGHVMSKVHKSPISRIRTRQADVRGTDLTALGYKKGNQKKLNGLIKMLSRTTDPQTVYVKDFLNRDDIIDITDFDVVEYLYGVMRSNLMEKLATAIMLGDDQGVGDDKISEDHIRPIWGDEDPYVIHSDVDIAAMKKELQGSNTSANFGENYIYAEAVVQSALYAREKYKGSGSLEFYCDPHLLNVMLLARDLNGRRIYSSKSDLAAALNVTNIITVEQFANKVRTTSVEDGSKQKKLLGIFVNLNDYYVGSTKGGEITRFNQFDIDFNQEKYLIETRISGALTRAFSAIVLEEPVVATTEPENDTTDEDEAA